MQKVNFSHGDKTIHKKGSDTFSANWCSIVKDSSQLWCHINGTVKVKTMDVKKNGRRRDI
jgi:hypothetical protein